MLSENADLAELNTSKKGMLFPTWGKKNKKKIAGNSKVHLLAPTQRKTLLQSIVTFHNIKPLIFCIGT